MSDQRKVWITGVGAATPLGSQLAAVMEGLLAGRSGVKAKALFPSEPETTQIVAPVDEIPAPQGVDRESFEALDPLERMTLHCAVEALADAGLWRERSELRIGLILGYGAEWMRIWEMDAIAGGRRIYRPELDTQSTATTMRRQLALAGPAIVVGAACASGNLALGLGKRWIEAGLVDVCLAGSCDLATPITYANFQNLRALSRRADAPAAASRPFDADRDGFVMGEGGAMFVLESASFARRRGARPHAELAGFGAASDGSHMIIPNADGRCAALAVRAALDDAAIDAGEIDYINAHATSTPVGDRAETRALHLALGPAAAGIPVSATKSMTGHLLSGAASIEAIACLAALKHQAIPPTINLDHVDPECDLLHVANEARPAKVRLALSNSFGFGGSNTCIVLRKAA